MFLVLDRGYLSKKSKDELDVVILVLRLLPSNVRVGVLPLEGETSMWLPIQLHWTQNNRINREKKMQDYAYTSTALFSGHLPERLNTQGIVHG